MTSCNGSNGQMCPTEDYQSVKRLFDKLDYKQCSATGMLKSACVSEVKITHKCKPLNKRNEAKVLKLHPKIRCAVRDFINDTEKELGIKLIIVQGLRTYAEQNKIYAKGRTLPGKIVTKVKAGYSKHNLGVTIDVFPLHEDGKLHMGDDAKNIKLLKKVAPIGKCHGFEWGGDWKKFIDCLYFEKSYGKSTAELRKLYEKSNGKIEKIPL